MLYTWKLIFSIYEGKRCRLTIQIRRNDARNREFFMLLHHCSMMCEQCKFCFVTSKWKLVIVLYSNVTWTFHTRRSMTWGELNVRNNCVYFSFNVITYIDVVLASYLSEHTQCGDFVQQNTTPMMENTQTGIQ